MHENDKKFIDKLRAWCVSDDESLFILASINKTSLPIFKDDIKEELSDEEILQSLVARTKIN